MNVVILIMAIFGLILIYSAMKDKNPVDVIKGAFKK